MVTSSITKDFYVKDEAAYQKLKKDIESSTSKDSTGKSYSLEYGRVKLKEFNFK